jgi:hypothetical protein
MSHINSQNIIFITFLFVCMFCISIWLLKYYCMSNTEINMHDQSSSCTFLNLWGNFFLEYPIEAIEANLFKKKEYLICNLH